MNINKINKNIQTLENSQSDAITNLIDLKVDNDMDKVLDAISNLKTDMDSKFQAIESTMDSKFQAMDSKLALNKYATVGMTVTALGALIVFIQYFPALAS